LSSSHALHHAAMSRALSRVRCSGRKLDTGSPGFGGRFLATQLLHRALGVLRDERIAARWLSVPRQDVDGIDVTRVADRDCEIATQPPDSRAFHRAPFQQDA